MNALPKFLLLPLFFIGLFTAQGRPDGAVPTATWSVEVDKEKPKKKKRATARKRGVHPRSTTAYAATNTRYRWQEQKSTSDQTYFVDVLGFTLIVLSFLALPTLFIIGGVTGGVGWLIAGAVLAGLFLLFCYVCAITDALYLYQVGLGVAIFVAAVFLALLIWALWAIVPLLPLLLVLSVIFGALSLVCIGIYVVKDVLWRQ